MAGKSSPVVNCHLLNFHSKHHSVTTPYLKLNESLTDGMPQILQKPYT